MTQHVESFKFTALTELSKQFESWGFTDIRTPHMQDRYPTTKTIGQHQPDMTFKKNHVLFLVEVATLDTLEQEGIMDKWLGFSEQAKETKGCFWILVAEGQSMEMIRRTNEWRIEASIHEF